jgi:protocatechuate 4,5-dioxygenase alpha chain
MERATADMVPTNWRIPGTYVFDGSRSRLGYNLNRMAFTLTAPANRERFRADEDAYMAEFGLTGEQKQAVRDRDWLRLTKNLGGNIYYMYKLGATVGQGLYHMGAQMRGQSYEDFLATRAAKGAS